MNIRGMQKTSLVDYPGHISTVFFTGGCNLNCKYCHNPSLVCNRVTQKYSTADVISFLNSRKGLIDGVVISGGEPTLSKNIEPFFASLKTLSIPVKLDTNGLNPDIIQKLVNGGLVDYIAIDIKTSPEKYEFLTNKKTDFNDIKKTVSIVRDSGIEYELRTTCIPYFVTLDDFIKIKNEIGQVKRYYLQQFVNEVTLDETLKEYEPYPVSVLHDFRNYVKTFSQICEIRGI